MTQSDIDRAVARRTGESTTLIRRMGFVLLAPHAYRLRKHNRPNTQPQKRGGKS